jgi:hypothetical protein
MDHQVKIGPEFFAKIKLDYADWRWALVREFLQNCFDAPQCKTVAVTVARQGSDTVLTVSNDGSPMSEATLKDKLLTLGGSGKNFEGENIGGFGVAKSLLYYTHRSYTIHTGALLVQGCGAQYSIAPFANNPGTTSTIVLIGDEVAKLEEQVKRFAAYAQWRGTLTLNGVTLPCGLHKGSRRKDMGWGVVYTNTSFQNLCIVRLNGQPMFTRYTRFKGCVLIELTGKAKDVLTSNRDGLTGVYASELSDFLTNIAIDKRSALKEQRAEYKRYQGEKQRNAAKQPKASDEGLASVVDLGQIAAQVKDGGAAVAGDQDWLDGPGVAPTEHKPQTANGGIKLVVESREDEPDRTVSVGPEFIIKNTTGKKLAPRYVPGDKFHEGSRHLVRAWTSLLLKLHQLCNKDGEFSVGFVFDEESVAECERTSAYGQGRQAPLQRRVAGSTHSDQFGGARVRSRGLRPGRARRGLRWHLDRRDGCVPGERLRSGGVVLVRRGLGQGHGQ